MMFNVLKSGMQGDNNNVLKCNATVDVDAASIRSNTISAFSAGTGGAVAFAKDFMATRGRGGRGNLCHGVISATHVLAKSILDRDLSFSSHNCCPLVTILVPVSKLQSSWSVHYIKFCDFLCVKKFLATLLSLK